MSARTPVARWAAAWTLAAAAVLALPTPAAGHALLRTTEPAAEAILTAPPRQVVLRFSEPVEAAFGAVRVFDTDGGRIDNGRARHEPGDPRTVTVGLRPRLPDGTYTVSWRVVSADGHPVSEAFLFHVGAPGANASVALADVVAREQGSGSAAAIWLGVSRWLLFAGLILLIGGWAFGPLVWRPVNGEVPPALVAARRGLLRTGWWLAAVATLTGAVGQVAVAAGLPLHRALSPALLAELLRTRYGMVAAARLGLLVLLVPFVRSGRGDRRAPGLAAAALVLLAATPGLSGHAGATAPPALHLVADALHVAAAGVWLGGLVLVRRVLRPDVEAAAQQAAAARFSAVALRAVGLLVLTGLVRSWAEVGAPRALWSTPFGLVLLAKLAVFLPILALAAWNRARVRLTLAADAGALRRSVTVEAALGAVVLALTALLVNLPPAKVAAGLAGPAITEAALGDGRLDVVVDPNVVGENVVHLTMTGGDGRPLDVDAVRVWFRMPAQDIGPLEAEALRLGAGHFAVQGRQLSVPGRWTIEVAVPVDRFTDLRATVSLRVNG